MAPGTADQERVMEVAAAEISTEAGAEPKEGVVTAPSTLTGA